MNVERILWPTDFTEHSAKALPWLTSLADTYNAEILALNVVDPPTRFEHLADLLGADEVKRFKEASVKHSTEKLFQTCDEHLGTCRLMDKKVVAGDPAEQIVKVARQENIDLIVMAPHSYDPVRRYTMGSVAEQVLRSSPVPVLVVKEE